MNRDSLGFINLDLIDKKDVIHTSSFRKINFIYNNEKYYYKRCKGILNCYYELIAHEIAKQMNLESCNYDLATYVDELGVVSKNFLKENDEIIRLETLLCEVYKDKEISKYNNLKDIENALNVKFGNNITIKLMEQLIKIFIFDVIIGNIDRHMDNMFLVENKTINFSPIFDNEKMLSSASIDMGIYSLGIDRDDYKYSEEDYNCSDNFIYKFIEEYSEYKDMLISSLNIIEDDNLDIIFSNIEFKINSTIDDNIKRIIKEKFKKNREMIKNVLNSKVKRL
ncbi:MAG: hypothetical protein E7157_05680 [Lactobacillales bacterium]|nr:hypothetical protein [Lactobacillales bacterium]